MLSVEDFSAVIRLAPLVSIDLIVRNERDEVLLGLRRNAPAQNFWFTPGGRIYKNEPIEAAKARIMSAELGGVLKPDAAQRFGVFEHFYDDNFFGSPDFGTHYVVLAYKMTLPAVADTQGEAQHSRMRWWPLPELLESAQVHPFVKAYF